MIVYGDIIAGTTSELLATTTKQRPLPQAGVNAASLWPKVGAFVQIPYVDNSNLPEVRTIIDAVNRQFVNIVQWVPRNQETEYVIFQSQTGACNSIVGRRTGRPQPLNTAPGCTLHEMGHAMGLLHAEQQPDRDKFITMFDAELDVDRRASFDIASGTRPLGGYSYLTAVAYDPMRLSRAGRPAYETIPPGIVLQNTGDLFPPTMWTRSRAS